MVVVVGEEVLEVNRCAANDLVKDGSHQLGLIYLFELIIKYKI